MGHRILIADDDPVLQDVLSTALQLHGYSPQAYGTAEAVMSALRVEHWDLVLLDSLGVTPCEETSTLTSITELAGSTPVLLMTGSIDLAEWAYLNVKLAGILLKPFELQPFLNQVSRSARSHPILAQWWSRPSPLSSCFLNVDILALLNYWFFLASDATVFGRRGCRRIASG